jgi:hypothetical protein
VGRGNDDAARHRRSLAKGLQLPQLGVVVEAQHAPADFGSEISIAQVARFVAKSM